MKDTKRNYRYDNLKAVLILLVLIGHILETNLAYGINREIYLLIYSFHMPFFAYITGYFSKPSLQKMVQRFFIPYILFQTFYIGFENFILGNSMEWQYTKPYWILWYLVAVIWWNLCLLVFQRCKETVKIIIFLCSMVIAIMAGYVEGIGRELALERTLVFLPFFLWGYISRGKTKEVSGWKISLNMMLSIIWAGLYLVNADVIKITWLYEANSYQAGHYSILFRSFHLLGAVFMILFLRIMIPNKRIPCFSYIGKNTMPTYLLHGFVIKWIGIFTPLTAGISIFLLVWVLPLVDSTLSRFKQSFSPNNHNENNNT